MAIPIRHSDPAQIAAGARTFFVTSSISGKRNLLHSDRSAQVFVRSLYEYRAQRKFRLHEFVVMPHHIHVLLTPITSLEKAVQFIKGGFSYRAKKELGSNLEVWQKGFSDHRIRDANDYRIHQIYVQENPVRKHLCGHADQYAYSSAGSKFELDPALQGLKLGFRIGILNRRGTALPVSRAIHFLR